MNYTKLFYWLVVADNAKAFFVVFIIIFTIVAAISTIAYFINGAEKDYESQKMSRKWMWYSLPFMILFCFWALYVFTPNKKDALLIVAGGQTMNYLTTDSTAKQVPHEVLNFIVAELRSMASDAKVELMSNDIVLKKKEEIQNMLFSEIMEKAKTDSTYAKYAYELLMKK